MGAIRFAALSPQLGSFLDPGCSALRTEGKLGTHELMLGHTLPIPFSDCNSGQVPSAGSLGAAGKLTICAC